VITRRSRRFKHCKAISETYTDFLEEKGPAREVPIVEEDFAIAELVRGKHMDIEEAAGFGACDKLALRRLKATTTFLPSTYYNLFYSPILDEEVDEMEASGHIC